MTDHARSLERERDDARQGIELMRQNAEHWKQEAERWRKMCEEGITPQDIEDTNPPLERE